jgi:hypothetical protein
VDNSSPVHSFSRSEELKCRKTPISLYAVKSHPDSYK